MPGEVSRSYRGPVDRPKPMPEWPEPDIFKAIGEHAKRGGLMVFWTCPNGCGDIVDWHHYLDGSVATCRKCGQRGAEQRAQEKRQKQEGG